ncbi:T9SS type A sorting domain-containing protein [Lacinutrix sp. Hel_I_90]|uniref:T9SS type A sorting domain-containing protein n=1 Tax=Lacinutrix sp. Hel_I_90 TaxID=1249999 RepID=UPI0005C7F3C8|nr:T9SS type A sorting domain-containing protein [Lacinutrix sp. Hel_I_90]
MKLNFSTRNLIYFTCILCTTIASSQNLLNDATWTVGSGSAPGFAQNGPTIENSRELGYNHIGEQVVLWKASPTSDGAASGGWNTSYINIDHTKTYRFSVWLKKTNSNDGHSYLGCRTSNNSILRLDNTIDGNPYFWVGDLPKLDRWYLIVGYIHGSNYSSTVNLGRIYDGVTGEDTNIVVKDFKFKNTATNVYHRSYLYYDSNVYDRQYFCEPRIDGGTFNTSTIIPNINQLRSINQNSRIKFEYDTAGNQKTRYYCPNGDCFISKMAEPDKEEFAKEIRQVEDAMEDNNAIAKIVLHPNPTKGLVTINIESKLLSKVEFIKIYNANSSLIQEVKFKDSKGELQIDLSGKPTGLYFVHIHFNDGSESVTKKIIKE